MKENHDRRRHGREPSIGGERGGRRAWWRRIGNAPRGGVTLTETLLAAIVLTSVLGTITPMAVRQGRFATATRAERIALDELSNQLDRLTLLPAGRAAEEIAAVRPSPLAARTLGEPELGGELVSDEAGERMRLTLQWRSAAGRTQSRTAVRWLVDQESVGQEEAK